MSSNVIHVNFTSKQSLKTKSKEKPKEKKQSSFSLIIKALNPFDEEKSLFMRSLAFMFFI